MSKVSEAFKNGKAFIAFITGGDPDLETTKKLILEIEKMEQISLRLEFHFQIQLQKDR